MLLVSQIIQRDLRRLSANGSDTAYTMDLRISGLVVMFVAAFAIGDAFPVFQLRIHCTSVFAAISSDKFKYP